MALFRYQGLTENGKKKVEGLLDAESHQEGLLLLQKRNLTITFFKNVEDNSAKPLLSRKEAILFFHSLSRLLEAGIPLYEALVALKERQTLSKSRLFVLDLCQKIKSGHSFAKALSFHENSIDILMISMVANGERSGTLSKSLSEISSFLSKQSELKKQMVSSLIYPSILLTFCSLLISALFFFIIPSLFELFDGRPLHPLTRVVLGISHFAHEHRIIILLAFLGVLGLGIYSFLQKDLRKILMGFFFSLPLLKKIFLLSALSRFCQGFSSLLSVGIELHTALQCATDLMEHPLLKRELEKTLPKLIEGQKLSRLLKEIPMMPGLVSQMISISEESGQMDKMFGFLGKMFEEELEKNLQRITTLIQPALIVILGMVIGLVVLSVLLPLTDVSSFIPD